MQEDLIIEQAKRFAKIVYRGASKFENLNELNARLNQELSPYDAKNKTIFISVWKDELVRLFHDHLQKCSNNDCPKNKTSKNAGFIVDQYTLSEKKN